jgi:hypothetical protein
MKNQLRRFLPHIVVVALFAAMSALYFMPAFQDYNLRQGDTINFRGMAQEIIEFRRMFGQEPLWTNSMFSGMPAYQISVQYPNNIVKMIDGLLSLGLPRPANYFFLYLLGFYILLVSFKVKPHLAAIGAAAFALSSYNLIILEAGHNTKAHAIAYMAPTLAGIIWAFRGRYLFGAAFAGLFLALQINANHVQITYYFGMLVALLALALLVQAVREKEITRFAKAATALAAAAALAVLSNANVLWNTYEYGKYTTRGKSELTITPTGESNSNIATGGLDRDYVTQWSYGRGETLTFLVPNARGGESGVMLTEDLRRTNPEFFNLGAKAYQETGYLPYTYWGEQPFTSGPVYFGAVICLLFLLCLLYVQGPLKWALLATTILTTMLSWGKNLMWLTDFFLDNIPGYDKFRAVTIILGVTSLTMPLMAFMFLKHLYDKPAALNQPITRFYIAAGGLIAILAALYITPGSFMDFMSERDTEFFATALSGNEAPTWQRLLEMVREGRMADFRADVSRSLLLVAAASALLWFYHKEKLKPVIFSAILGVLVIADMWPVAKRYLNNEKERGKYVQWQPVAETKSAHKATTADLTILEQESLRNPRTKDAIDSAVAAFRTDAKDRKGPKPTEDELNDVRFAALRFNTNYRVFSLLNPFNDARVAYFHKSIGGYHGAKLQRYQELISFHLDRELREIVATMQSYPTRETLAATLQSTHVLNMLNTKYIIFNNDAGPLPNSASLGSAWFVEELTQVKNADEEITRLSEINPRYEALVDKRFAYQLSGFTYRTDSAAAIAVEEHLPNLVRYIYDSSTPQAVIFSEIYYEDGWNAYIDGQSAPYFRANYVLRGMIVPEGAHTIEFRFEPETYAIAATTSTAAGLALSALVLLALYYRFRQKEEEIDF